MENSVSNSSKSIAVIGSGLAGGLLTLALSRSANVTLFERGRKAHTAPEVPRFTGHPLGLPQTFGYGLGGTTNLWRGSMLSMRPEEFGVNWPVSVSDQLRTYSHEVVRILYGAKVAREWEIRRRAKQNDERILDTVFTPRIPSRIAKLSGLRAATVRLNSLVEDVEETAAGVRLTVRAHGRIKQLEFDYVILAAGAINSPLLLKRSGLGGAQVGLNLTDHPMGMVAKIARTGGTARYDAMAPKGRWKKVAKLQDPETGLWTSFQLCPAHDLLFERDEYLATAHRANLKSIPKFPAWNKLASPEYRAMMARKISGHRQLGKFAFVLAMSEQECRGQGRIGEINDQVNLDWQVSDRVCDAIGRSLVGLGQWLGCDLHPAPGALKNRIWSGAHHAGTCRMSNDVESGVVDHHLQVHDTSRVFVCDASVLPSTGASNTGLTIGSLALRLEAHLSQK